MARWCQNGFPLLKKDCQVYGTSQLINTGMSRRKERQRRIVSMLGAGHCKQKNIYKHPRNDKRIHSNGFRSIPNNDNIIKLVSWTWQLDAKTLKDNSVHFCNVHNGTRVLTFWPIPKYFDYACSLPHARLRRCIRPSNFRQGKRVVAHCTASKATHREATKPDQRTSEMLGKTNGVNLVQKL